MYEEEISMMSIYSGNMAGMVPGAAEYIEKVIQSHIKRILSRVKKISRSTTEVQDVCFILRNDKELITKIKDSICIKQIKNNIDDELGDYKMTFEFTDENVNQNTKENKLMILDKITQDMDRKEYVEYTKFRETSFTNGKRAKFIEFLNVGTLSGDVIDVFGIVARNLVFDIVQRSIKVRNEKYRKRTLINIYKLDSDRSPLSLREIEEGTRRVYFNLPYII